MFLDDHVFSLTLIITRIVYNKGFLKLQEISLLRDNSITLSINFLRLFYKLLSTLDDHVFSLTLIITRIVYNKEFLKLQEISLLRDNSITLSINFLRLFYKLLSTLDDHVFSLILIITRIVYNKGFLKPQEISLLRTT
jgi:predicted DNA-binding antitoxin AbrB/MazE fold protein